MIACLADVSYDPVYGARLLDRAIQRELKTAIALQSLISQVHSKHLMHDETLENAYEKRAIALVIAKADAVRVKDLLAFLR